MELPASKKVSYHAHKTLSLLVENQVKHDGNKRDRLSELSDDILIGILSSLPSREAAGVCFLSHRWQHLWKFLPVSFRFDGTKTKNCIDWDDVLDVKIKILKTERCKFVGWINNVLNSHQGSIIDELCIRFDLDKDWGCDINKWIDIALRKQVKKLELDFSRFRCPRHYNMYYPFPGLSGTEFLTCLSLQYLGVTDEIMESILSNCPMLESLHLRFSPLLLYPKVSGSSLRLKHLDISFCHFIQSLEVCAPNLVSFEYSGKKIQFYIRYAPKLQELCYYDPRNYGIMHAFFQLARYIRQLVALTFCIYNIEEQLWPYPKLIPKLINLRHFTYKVKSFHGKSLLGLASMIEDLPFLHKFKVEIYNSNEIDTKGKVPKVAGHPHLYLKDVEFVGFLGQTAEAELLSYLVKSAIMLEKIVVDTRSQLLLSLEAEESMEFVETLQQMAKTMAHQLLEDGPKGAELIILCSISSFVLSIKVSVISGCDFATSSPRLAKDDRPYGDGVFEAISCVAVDNGMLRETYSVESTVKLSIPALLREHLSFQGRPSFVSSDHWQFGKFPLFLSRVGPAPTEDIPKEAPVAVGDGEKPSCGCLGRDSIANAAAKVAPAVVNLSVPQDGTILTCAHVVVDSQGRRVASKGKVDVTLQDGRTFEGIVVNADLHSDIAIVKIKSKTPLPTAKLSSSSKLRPGDWVIAMGCPLTLQNTVTASIVSCVDRKSSDLGLGGMRREYLQTDCATNAVFSFSRLVCINLNVAFVLIIIGIIYMCKHLE
ncbi:hypothetical protein REPUB_Repub16aG0139200 [Reevesia pubescens]